MRKVFAKSKFKLNPKNSSKSLLQCHANSCNDIKTVEWNFKKICQSMSSPSQIKDQQKIFFKKITLPCGLNVLVESNSPWGLQTFLIQFTSPSQEAPTIPVARMKKKMSLLIVSSYKQTKRKKASKDFLLPQTTIRVAPLLLIDPRYWKKLLFVHE